VYQVVAPAGVAWRGLAWLRKIKLLSGNYPFSGCGFIFEVGQYCGLLFRKSLTFASSLIKHLRPEMESISTNYMPDVVSD
jgi:hypothetical protein